MSKKFLKELLNEANNALSKELANEFRGKLDLSNSVATFSSSIITKAIYNQIRFTYQKGKGKAKYSAWRALTPEQRKEAIAFIKQESSNVMEDLYNSYKAMKKDGLQISVRGTPERFTVNLIVLNEEQLEKAWRGPKQVDIGSFQAVKDGYRNILNKTWKKIGDYVQEVSGVKDKAFKDKPFNLEHRAGESVAERRVANSIQSLYDGIKSVVKSDEAVSQIIKELGLETELNYLSTIDFTRVKLFVGSSSKNKRQATLEKELVEKARQRIEAAINEKLLYGKKAPENWKGSDDRVTIETKKIIGAYEDTLKESSTLKITSKNNTKPNLSSNKVKGKIKIPLKVNKKTTTFKPKVNKSVQIGKRSLQSTFALADLINKKLPQTVLANMKPPALRNRTGRFARSVQITDVMQTPRGYPSIGYTYQKNPYQTFEVGRRQGSNERDPRTLIDKSIREIAAGLLLGRFFTRRN